jgi:hypothetical protein
MVEACRFDEGNPGLELGLGARRGVAGGARQDLHAEGKRLRALGRAARRRVDGQAGQGAVPAPGESPDGADRQAHELRLADPYELGQEFFRWEFGTAVAGSILGINPFDQPDVQAAKDRTNEVLASGRGRARDESPPPRSSRAGAAGRLRLHPGVRRSDSHRRGALGRSPTSGARPDRLRRHPRARAALPPLDRPAAQGRARTRASSSRSSRTTARSSRSRRDFGFARLIRAQAAGDFESLRKSAADASRASNSRSSPDAARNDRTRPHGRQHDRASPRRRPRREDVPSTASTSSTPAPRAASGASTDGYCLMVGGTDEPVAVSSRSSRRSPRGRLRPRRPGRRRPLRQDGPQRDRVRPDAGLRRGLRDHGSADEFDLDLHEIAGIWRYGSVVRSAGCSSCSTRASSWRADHSSSRSRATSRTRAKAAGRSPRRSPRTFPSR